MAGRALAGRLRGIDLADGPNSAEKSDPAGSSCGPAPRRNSRQPQSRREWPSPRTRAAMCPCAGRAPGRRFFEELRDALLGGLAFRRASGLVVRIVRVDLEMDQAQRPERAGPRSACRSWCESSGRPDSRRRWRPEPARSSPSAPRACSRFSSRKLLAPRRTPTPRRRSPGMETSEWCPGTQVPCAGWGRHRGFLPAPRRSGSYGRPAAGFPG